jgi:hypothetical protein
MRRNGRSAPLRRVSAVGNGAAPGAPTAERGANCRQDRAKEAKHRGRDSRPRAESSIVPVRTGFWRATGRRPAMPLFASRSGGAGRQLERGRPRCRAGAQRDDLTGTPSRGRGACGRDCSAPTRMAESRGSVACRGCASRRGCPKGRWILPCKNDKETYPCESNYY